MSLGKKNKVLIDLQERIRKVKPISKTFEFNFHRCSTGVKVSGHEVTSILLISAAVLEDAGLYSYTWPVLGKRDSPRARVMVHVIGPSVCVRHRRLSDTMVPL
jgi:hypothetical protein